MADEGRYYTVLRRIAKDYQTPAQIQRAAEKQWGLPYVEALEMAYENMQAEAATAIRGKRAPKEEMVHE